MIKSKILFKSMLLLIAAVHFISCGVDRWPEYAAETAQDEWIDSVMRKNYLWYSTIPQGKYLNYFTAPSTFLQSILYKNQDNQYSYVDTVITSPIPSYGFEYSLQNVAGNDTAKYALISMVLADSPASDAGLIRGDYIMKVDGEYITSKNQTTLLNSGGAVELIVGEYKIIEEEDEEGTITSKGAVVELGETSMAAFRAVENNPIHYYTVITTETGVKLGYLVYNRFENGTISAPEKYANQLREVSNYFAQNNVTHFALDLRYNTGGHFESTELLASILTTTNEITTQSAYADLEFNDLRSDQNGAIKYNREIIGNGSNLNIYQGFVISSSATSPGVTGVFLNCISAVQPWALIGSSIKCWGFATENFTNPRFAWSVNPVVCSVFNSKGESNEGATFTPNVVATDNSNMANFLPFGNPKEALLSTVIGIIDGTITPSSRLALEY